MSAELFFGIFLEAVYSDFRRVIREASPQETSQELTFSPPSSLFFLFSRYRTLPKGILSTTRQLPVDLAIAHYLHGGVEEYNICINALAHKLSMLGTSPRDCCGSGVRGVGKTRRIIWHSSGQLSPPSPNSGLHATYTWILIWPQLLGGYSIMHVMQFCIWALTWKLSNLENATRHK